MSLSVVVVSLVMVTTAGLTRSTRSAKLKGALFSSMRGARAPSLSLAASMVGSPAVWIARTGGNSAKAPRPITTTAAAVPIAARRRWRRLGLGRREKRPAFGAEFLD